MAYDNDTQAFLDRLGGKSYDDDTLGFLKRLESGEPPPAAPEKPSALRRYIADPAISLAKGVIGVPEAAVGLADIPTMGLAGQLAEEGGFRPKEAKAALDTLYSPEQQAANKKVQDADGFLSTLVAAVQNPSTIAHTGIESVPSMLGGGAMARGLTKAGMAALPAAAVGEGAVSAGQTAEQIRQDTGGLTAPQAGIAALSGGLTGLLNLAGGSIAKKLGIADVDSWIAGASQETKRGLAKRVIGGMVSEGLLEELPQSAQEQVAQNLAEGKPWDEGVGKASAMGALVGAAMGGGANIPSHQPPKAPVTEPPKEVLAAGSVDDAIAAAEQALSEPPQALPFYAGPPMVSFPDGSVLTGAEAQSRGMAPLPDVLNAGTVAGPVQPEGSIQAATEPKSAPGADLQAEPKNPVEMTMRELVLGAKLTRSEERRADISAEIERRADVANAQQSSASVEVSPQEQPDARAVEISQPEGGASAQTQAPVGEGTHPAAAVQEAPSAGPAEAQGEVGGPSVQTPAGAQPAPAVEAPAGQGAADEATSTAAGAAPQFTDYIAPKTVGKVIKGETRIFKSERVARAFAKQNGLPRTWTPRESGDGWVLSKPIQPKDEARAAAASARARQVRQDDDAGTMLRKLGGVRADAVDGADPADMKSANRAGFGALFRKDGGMTLDSVAEVLAGQGFDTLDEAGRPDATKANEILHQILAGERVYTPDGMEMRAAKEQERRARGMEPTPEEQTAGTTVQADAADVARVVDLTMLDETTAERLALQFENDDAGYLAAVEETLNDQDHAAVADGETRGQAPAGAEASLSREDALSALRQAVEAIRAASPEETPSLTPALDRARRAAERAGLTAQEIVQAMGSDRRPMGPEKLAQALEPKKPPDEAVPFSRDRSQNQNIRPPKENAPELALTGETNAEILAKEAQERQNNDAKRKRDNAPSEKDFNLTGSDTAQDQARAQGQRELGDISDFGEKIGGARKDVWASFKDEMDDAKTVDITAEPLSKSWPAPDYNALIEAGADPWAVAFMHASRDAIQAKPRQGWKVRAWADQVKLLRDAAFGLADGTIDVSRAKHLLSEMAGKSRSMADIAGRIELYSLVGHEKSLDGVRISQGDYSLYEGKEYNPAKVIWTVEKDQPATAFSNWPRVLAQGDTKEQALADFKQKYASLEITRPVSKDVTFDIFSKRGENGYWIGKKVGRNPLLLAGPFTNVKEARAYKADHQADLLAKLDKAKEIPNERRDTNEPRVGADMRNGQNVTPQMFGETFGFRGVEFGNWVEQGKRQNDLNDAFDALMDMAAILGVPPKAISLNGELGLAFGARGTGGMQAAKAHYEPGFVVINLTKKDGAGSIGHEWWHALDNYFSRTRGKSEDYLTEALDTSLAARGSQYVHQGAVRKEMVDAFGQVVKAINSTALKARASRLDSRRSKEYWTTGREMSARAFESYLISKLQDQNASNDYLANIVDEATWKAAEGMGFELDDSYPYPTAGEVPAIRAGFDHLFQTIQTKETDKGVALFARGNQAKSGLDRAKFETALAGAFGEKAAGRLIDSGVVTPVERQSDLPSAILKWARDGDVIYGVEFGGKTYAVLENLTPEMVKPLVMHEVGVHYGFEKMLGAERYAGVMKRLDAMIKSGNKAAQEARAQAEAEASHESLVPEETLAYLIQNHPEMSFVQKIISAIKTWVYRNLGIGASTLTQDDLAALARAAVLHSASIETPAISTEAQPAWHRNDKSKTATPSPTSRLSPEILGRAPSVVQLGVAANNSVRAGEDVVNERGAMFSRSHATPEWADTDALKSAASKVETYAPGESIKQKAQKLKENWKERMVQGVFDAYAPLKRLGPTEYVKARMVKSADGALEGTLLYGKPKMGDDGAIYGDIDKKGFLGAMQELKGEHDRFFMWIAGNRAKRLMNEGREHLFTKDEITAMRGLAAGKMKDGTSRTEAYAKAAETLKDYNKAVLDIAEKTGLIDAESRHLWEHDFYVPFFRVGDDMKIDGPSSKVKGLVRQQAFKKLTGGTEPLGDLLANTLQNWSHLISASMANQAAVASLKAAKKVGIAEEVPEGTKGATYAMENGQKVYYAVDDPFILSAISAMESASFKGLPMQVMSKFKHYLTMGVTASPTFRVRNLIRDSVSAIGQNEMSYNVMSNIAQGYKGTKRGSDDYAQMLFNGALMRFGQLTDGKHAEHAKRLINEGVDGDTILTGPEKVKAALGRVWDEWQEFGDRMENVNRTALYKQLIAEGKTPLEAAFAARDMMDFSLQGSSTAVRFLTQIVPFMNARLQGLYKLGRATGDNPARMGYVLGATALASIALMLAYKDDDDWKKREDWDRDNFWWFKVGDKAFRIPKPFEIGAMGTLAERSVELAISDEMTGKRFADRMKAMLGDTFSLNPVPQLFKPMLDLYSNKDSFTGRQIETRGMENLSKSERMTPGTSLVAKLLGQAGDATNLSPVQIDHLIQSYFGWLGAHAAMTADLMAQPFMDSTKPSRRLGDTFVIGDFVKDLPSDRSRYVEQFYKQAKTIHEAMGDLKAAREARDLERVKEILEDKKSDIALSSLYSTAERRMSEINRQIKVANASKKSAEEKRAEIDRWTTIRNELAAAVETKATRVREAVAR